MFMLLALLAACNGVSASPPGQAPSDQARSDQAPSDHDRAPVPEAAAGQAVAIFAGGCFWCMESDFDRLAGVVATTSGFAGGHTQAPTYEAVSAENTGHAEAVRVIYDTSKLTYAQVLDYYWRHTDPTDGGGQFCDRGDSYRPVVFYLDDAQKQAALASKAAVEGLLGKSVATQVAPAGTFWAAEVYHQDFHVKSPARYEPYRRGCGRDARVKAVWAGHPG